MSMYWNIWDLTNFNRILQICCSIEVHVLYISHIYIYIYIYICWLFYIFLLLLKLLQLRWMAVICLHINVTGIFWAKANSLETNNICYLTFYWRLLLTCWIVEVTAGYTCLLAVIYLAFFVECRFTFAPAPCVCCSPYTSYLVGNTG